VPDEGAVQGTEPRHVSFFDGSHLPVSACVACPAALGWGPLGVGFPLRPKQYELGESDGFVRRGPTGSDGTAAAVGGERGQPGPRGISAEYASARREGSV
jgi:hypothetical protein